MFRQLDARMSPPPSTLAASADPFSRPWVLRSVPSRMARLSPLESRSRSKRAGCARVCSSYGEFMLRGAQPLGHLALFNNGELGRILKLVAPAETETDALFHHVSRLVFIAEETCP